MGALTVAVVGAGPAGLYLTDELVRHGEREVRVDLFERLPTPFGLLRYGVAPDHLKMKALAVPLQRTVDHDAVRLLANVEVGRDIAVEELRQRYSAVVYTYGAAADRDLGIPGEGLSGSTSAADFVRWYSGHPDAGTARALLESESVVVVGAGNVALDVTRMLVKDPEELATTDVPDEVLDALRSASTTDVHLLIRRGPAQVKFTSKELRELGELHGVDVIVDPAFLDLSTEETALVDADRAVGRNVAIFREWSARGSTGAPRRIHLHFWTAPSAYVGDEVLTEVRTVATRGDQTSGGAIPAGLAVRCVGYRGSGLPGVPFDEETGRIPTRNGRVLRESAIARGEYAAGWISRGPTGVLGTNRANATEVVAEILSDDLPDKEAWDVVSELAARGVEVVARDGWAAIDGAESERGANRGAPRTKITAWSDLLAAARRK